MAPKTVGESTQLCPNPLVPDVFWNLEFLGFLNGDLVLFV